MVDTDVNLDEQQYALNLDPESPPHSVDSTFDTLTGLDIFPLNKNTVGPIGAGNIDYKFVMVSDDTNANQTELRIDIAERAVEVPSLVQNSNNVITKTIPSFFTSTAPTLNDRFDVIPRFDRHGSRVYDLFVTGTGAKVSYNLVVISSAVPPITLGPNFPDITTAVFTKTLIRTIDRVVVYDTFILSS